jgi:hypothetical protein
MHEGKSIRTARMMRMARERNPEEPAVERPEGEAAPNAVWFKPVMVGFMLLGLVWILVYYISGSRFPIPGLDSWNLGIGLGIALIGFLMTTRWR